MGMQQTPLLMSRLIDRAGTISPEAEVVTATESGSRRITYGQSLERSHQLAHALMDQGLKKGDVIGSFMWNGSRHLELYHATAGTGLVLHTLNTRLSDADLEYMINHAADKLVFVDADLLPLLEELQDRIPKVGQYVVASEPGFENWSTRLPNAIDYEEFIAGKPTNYSWPTFDEYAPLGLCYTSGTTGNPKGVEYEHRAQYIHTLTIGLTDSMNLSTTDCMCLIVPMFHAMGWGLPWAALMLGCKLVLPHRYMQPARLAQLMADEKVTVSAGVPTIWQGLKAEIETNPQRYNLSRLSRLTCGGSAPPASLIEWYWNELGVEIIQGWGMTEMSPLGTLSRRVGKYSHWSYSDDERIKTGAKTGLLMPGLELDIFDDDFNRLPHDGESVGEICVRGPWICNEYFNNPQPDRFRDDWLFTGDVGVIDSEEYLIIADRSKDLIKSGGEWISSVDLENEIVAVDGVAQACVVAQPHPRWDERPVALVILKPGSEVSEDDILEHCAIRFAKWQLPDEVIYVDEIPLTSTGKLDKKTVRANLEAEGYKLPELR